MQCPAVLPSDWTDLAPHPVTEEGKNEVETPGGRLEVDFSSAATVAHMLEGRGLKQQNSTKLRGAACVNNKSTVKKNNTKYTHTYSGT